MEFDLRLVFIGIESKVKVSNAIYIVRFLERKKKNSNK